jgi:hypothetical protein
MVVSIVMAIFFQSVAGTGGLAGTLSIEGLLPAWCQQAAAHPTSTGHGCVNDQNEEGAARQATLRPARSLTASDVND